MTSHLEIRPGGLKEYGQLSRFHYREQSAGPFAAIYALCERHPVRSRFVDCVGVIVYKMPVGTIELRNIATGGIFTGFGSRGLSLQVLNKNVRCISRVIIEPRYRCLGLASYLVRETMGRLKVPVVEALAVMGRFNPFFERAGMKCYRGHRPLRCAKLTEALGMVGIDKDELIDPDLVQERISKLGKKNRRFIEQQMREFLEAYGKRKNMPRGIERTRYVLSKLTYRPAYYIWFNPNRELKVH